MIRRKVQIAGFICAVAAIGLVVFTAGFDAPASKECAQRQITDMTGRKVMIPTRPLRLLSLCGSATDTIVRLGAGGSLVAVDQYGAMIPGAQTAAVVGKDSALSREKILSLDIDLAFVWWYQDDAAASLEKMGIAVARVENVRAAGLPRMINFIGDCLGITDTAVILSGEVEGYLNTVVSRQPAKSVYLELYSPLKTIGGDCYINDLLTLAGFDNIASQTKGAVIVSAERLIEADPDVILFVDGFADVDAITRRSGFSRLTAVKNGNVFAIDRRDLVAGAGIQKAVENFKNKKTGEY